jgi:hypothetical protein
MANPKVNPAKRALGWLALCASILVGPAVFLLLSHGAEPPPGAPPTGPEAAACSSVVLLVLGGFFLVAGVFAYVFVALTHGLVLHFQKRPVWPRLKRRTWFANIAVTSSLLLGVGFVMGAVFTPLLTVAGLSPPLAFMVPVLGSCLLLQLASPAVHLWGPVERRALVKSMQAAGERGPWAPSSLFGVSDPGKSVIRKMFNIHDDVGALSIAGESLTFTGERGATSVLRSTARVSRESDAGSTVALFGISHVVLRFTDAAGAPRGLRFHPIGEVFIWRYKRRLDLLEQQLRAWLGPAA